MEKFFLILKNNNFKKYLQQIDCGKIGLEGGIDFIEIDENDVEKSEFFKSNSKQILFVELLFTSNFSRFCLKQKIDVCI